MAYDSAWHIVSAPPTLSVVAIISLLGQESNELRRLFRKRKKRMNGSGVQEEQEDKTSSRMTSGC